MPSKEIFLHGTGGLGNCMFQVAAAAYYVEMYGYSIKINSESSHFHFGTANHTNRDKRRYIQGAPMSYRNTIFNSNKLEYIKIENTNPMVLHNDYSSTIIEPSDNLTISGYCQNYNLFMPIADKLVNYFNLNDESIIEYIKTKYNISNTKHYIMVGIRACNDFSHMNKISKSSYARALQMIIGDNPESYEILIISDSIEKIPEKFEAPSGVGVKIIDEDDIAQFYAGLLCSSFVLSESTYHYWIALLKYIQDKTTSVYCFLDTDLTNRPLALPEWTRLPY